MCNEQLCFETLNKQEINTISERFIYFENLKKMLNNELTEICNTISKEYGLTYLAFTVESSVLGDGKPENHNHAVSVSISKTFALRVHLKSNCYRVEYRKKLSSYLALPDTVQLKEMKSYPDSIIIDFEDKNHVFFDVCLNILVKALEHYEPSDYFGCCGKYKECSNAKKCLHDDLFYAKACYYKKNLEAGRIFYGENANT